MIFRSMNILNGLKKIQYLSRDEMAELQSEKLRQIVQHAYDNVSYYKTLFDRSGITPSDIKDTRDILKIPITTKKNLQEAESRDLLSRGVDPERCVVKYTSGSTGQPLQFYFNEQERNFQSLLNLRILSANGFKLTDKTAYIINPHRFAKSRHWFQYLGVLRRYYLSVFDTAEAHVDALSRIRPGILYGYPSNLTLLALLSEERGVDTIRPKVVFSSAEALEQKPRAMISSAMNTDVCDILGLVEMGDIAWECPAHEGYHINSDAVIMEFLDSDDRPVSAGEKGRLVCTRLYGHTMPLIRYEVGDICVPSDKTCSCGRTLPLMESIQGRANDFIVLPNGQIIASCFLVIIMQDAHDVSQYRILQETKDGLRVQIVKGKNFLARTSEKITEEIRKVTGNTLHVEVEIVEELSRDKSGKIRTVVSKIAPNLKESMPGLLEEMRKV